MHTDQETRTGSQIYYFPTDSGGCTPKKKKILKKKNAFIEEKQQTEWLLQSLVTRSHRWVTYVHKHEARCQRRRFSSSMCDGKHTRMFQSADHWGGPPAQTEELDCVFIIIPTVVCFCAYPLNSLMSKKIKRRKKTKNRVDHPELF